MNITIIGATRGIGKEVVDLAKKNNFTTTILARNLENKTNAANKLIHGDFLNYQHVIEAISEAKVVVVAVGTKPTFKQVTLFSKGTANIIQATKELKTNPLIIAVTGIGAGDSAGHGGFIYDNIFKPLLLNTIYQDKNRQENLLKTQYNNWIIVRPGFLTNGMLTEKYSVKTNLKGVVAKKISRKDVAHFILNQTTDSSFLRQAPLLTY